MELPGIGGENARLAGGLEIYEDTQSGTRNGSPRSQFPDATVQYRAAFLQGEIPLPAGFSLIPGVRYDRFEYRTGSAFDRRSDSEVTPRIALGWQPRLSAYLWVEYAEAFRAPSLGDLFADGIHFAVPLGPGQLVVNEFVPTPDPGAEHGEQWQVGARWRRDSLFSREPGPGLSRRHAD